MDYGLVALSITGVGAAVAFIVEHKIAMRELGDQVPPAERNETGALIALYGIENVKHWDAQSKANQIEFDIANAKRGSDEYRILKRFGCIS